MCRLRMDVGVNELDGGLRLSQLSALSLLEMSSSESFGVSENGEPWSTSSYRRFRLRDAAVSMETLCLEKKRRPLFQ